MAPRPPTSGMEQRADSDSDCLNKLQLMATKGGRCRSLTLGEIEHASVCRFRSNPDLEPRPKAHLDLPSLTHTSS
jgi:hypothetical protein